MGFIASTQDARIDAILTGMSLQLPLDQGLIQDEVCPAHTVYAESDKYFVFDRVSAKEYDINVGLGAEINQFKQALSKDSYSVEEYGIGTSIANRIIKNSHDQVDLEESAVEDIQRIVRLGRERRVAKLVQTVSNWGSSTNLVTPWDNAAADIEADMDAATIKFHKQAGIMANTAVISLAVYRAMIKWLRSKPSAMSYGDYRKVEFGMSYSGVVESFSGLFNIDRWIVGMQIEDTAALGKDFVGDYIWSDYVTLLYIKKDAGRKDRTALKTFRYQDMVIRKRPDEAKRSIIIEGTHLVDERVVGKSLGMTLTNVIT
jgi:hypothetical protein